MKVLHDISKAGLVVYPRGSRLPVYDDPTDGKKIDSYDKGEAAGRTTGDILYMDNATVWLRVNLTKPSAIGLKMIGWVRMDYSTLAKTEANPKVDGKAEDMLNDMLKHDADIVRRLQRVYNAALILKKQGKNVDKISAVMGKLLGGVISRQNKLKRTEGVTLKRPLQANITINKISGPGVGAAPLVIYGLVALAGGIATVALYYAFRPDYFDSKKDFIITADLEKMIDANIADPKAREELKEKIKEVGQEQLKDAYKDGQTDQRFRDMWSVGKYALFGFGVFLLISKVGGRKDK